MAGAAPENKLIDHSELKLPESPGLIHLLASTHSGKTTLVTELLLHPDYCLSALPEKIIIFYSFMQPAYQKIVEKYGRKKVDLVKNYPGLTYFEDREEELRNRKGVTFVIFDDSDHVLFKDRGTVRLVTQLAHHCNLLLFILSQNVCVDSAIFRETTRNAQVYILWDNVRNRSSVRSLSSQIFGDANFLGRALADLNLGCSGHSRPLYIDMRPPGIVNEILRVRTVMVPSEKNHFVYAVLPRKQ